MKKIKKTWYNSELCTFILFKKINKRISPNTLLKIIKNRKEVK